MSFPRELFIWSEASYSLQAFEKYFRSTLPHFVQIIDGYLWKDEGSNCCASGEVFYIPVIGQQSRVLVKGINGRILSIPRDYKMPFCLADEQGCELGSPRLINDFVKDFSTWVDKRKFVNLSKDKNHQYIPQTYRHGQVVSETLDNAVEIINVYSERFLVAHAIVDDELLSKPMGIPVTELNLPVSLSICEGVKSMNFDTRETLLQRADHAITHLTNDFIVENVLERNIVVFSNEYVDEEGYSPIIHAGCVRLTESPTRPEVNNPMKEGWPIHSLSTPLTQFEREILEARSRVLSRNLEERYQEPSLYLSDDSTSSDESGYEHVKPSISRRAEDYEEKNEIPLVTSKKSDYSYVLSPVKRRWPCSNRNLSEQTTPGLQEIMLNHITIKTTNAHSLMAEGTLKSEKTNLTMRFKDTDKLGKRTLKDTRPALSQQDALDSFHNNEEADNITTAMKSDIRPPKSPIRTVFVGNRQVPSPPPIRKGFQSGRTPLYPFRQDHTTLGCLFNLPEKKVSKPPPLPPRLTGTRTRGKMQ